MKINWIQATLFYLWDWLHRIRWAWKYRKQRKQLRAFLSKRGLVSVGFTMPPNNLELKEIVLVTSEKDAEALISKAPPGHLLHKLNAGEMTPFTPQRSREIKSSRETLIEGIKESRELNV